MQPEEVSEHAWDDEAQDPEVGRIDVLIRLAYSLLFMVVISLLESLLVVVVVFQLLYSLATEALPSPRLQALANGIVAYFYQVLRYLTHNDSIIPFPFSDFPNPLEASRPPYAEHKAPTEAAE